MIPRWFYFLFFPLPLSAQFITHHNPVPQPDIPPPVLLTPFTEPSFNTSIVRISDARSSGLPGIFPDYSKRQAWNSDESLLMLRTANGEVLIYDGTTYQYMKTLPGNLTGIQDIFWHPTDPVTVYFVADNTISTMDVQSETITLLHTFANYIYVTTRAEGNMSNDAHFIALAGYDSNWMLVDYFVYDYWIDSVVGTLNAGNYVQDFDWISISPLGNYVVVDYANENTGQYNGVEVYDTQFNFLWQKPLGAGHSDLGLDSDGTEVLIMDIYDADSNKTLFKKFNLANGNETVLIGISPLFDQHESCRSMDRPGWVYISTFDYVGLLTDDSATWLPFEDEVFALKMDGSGTVQRLAHHYSRRYSPSTPNSDSSVYFSEPHATVNRDGTRILFGSNWRLNMEQDTSVDSYVVDISNMLTASQWNNDEEDRCFVRVYPNPNNGGFTIKIRNSESRIQNSEVRIVNVFGQEVLKYETIDTRVDMDLGEIAKGMYLYRISADGRTSAAGRIIIE